MWEIEIIDFRDFSFRNFSFRHPGFRRAVVAKGWYSSEGKG